MVSRTIVVDSSYHKTDLCVLGKYCNTDKSPYAEKGTANHRKGYTAVYDMLFSLFKNRSINFCEIGIEHGASLQMWEKYFDQASLYAFELDDEKIEKCKLLAPKTNILKTDASNVQALEETFKKTEVKFDIIIDDASHDLEHQRNVLKVAPQYLNSGGILIIEDLVRTQGEDIFDELIRNTFIFDSFIICMHANQQHDYNDKIWYGVKK
jgi:hypothetical protein